MQPICSAIIADLKRQCRRYLSSTAKTAQPSALSQVHQKIAGRQRFYKLVDVSPVDSSSDKTEYKITLDGRTLRTPGRNDMHLPNIDIAIAIAAEWDSQTNKKTGIQPATMPMMTIASTAIDQVKPDPLPTKVTCLSYLPTDSSLFWTSDEDRILLKKQRQHLEPVVRWARRELQIELLTSRGITGRLNHPPESLHRVQWMIDQLDHYSLTCLQSATMECKSIVLAFAYLAGHLSLAQTHAASRLEEEFQLEVWGVVEGGHDMDRLNNKVNLGAIGTFMGLYNSNGHFDHVLEKWRVGPVGVDAREEWK